MLVLLVLYLETSSALDQFSWHYNALGFTLGARLENSTWIGSSFWMELGPTLKY